MLWFQAVTPGTYRLFCTQLCGTGHAQMTGEIVAMTAPEYQKWLEQQGASETLAAAGKTLFMRNGCSGCHGGNGVGGSQAGRLKAPAREPPNVKLDRPGQTINDIVHPRDFADELAVVGHDCGHYPTQPSARILSALRGRSP